MDPNLSCFPTSTPDDLSTLHYQLQSICSALRPYQFEGQTQYANLPPALTMEIAQLYDRYGNPEALSNITRIPTEAIQAWHAEYQIKEEEVQVPDPCPQFLNMGMPGRGENMLVRRERDDAQRREMRFLKAKTPKEIRKLMPSYIYHRLLTLKTKVASQLLARKKQHQRAMLTPQMKHEAVQLIQAVGSVKPVALILGLDEGMLQVWKEATEISHVAGRYKLN